MIHLFDLDPRPVGLESGWELDVEAVKAEVERRFPDVDFVEPCDWNRRRANGAEPVPDDLGDEIDAVIVDLITADGTYYIEVGE